MTVDLHAAQEQGFFDGPVDHLTAMPILLDYVRNSMPLENTTIVSPGRRPHQGFRTVGPPSSADCRSPSSTRPATPRARTMPRHTASSVT